MKTLIITGGKINKNFAKKYLKSNKYDIIIAVDKGLETIDYLKLEPQYILGDFDSVNTKILEKYKTQNIKIIKLNPEKDLTDTHSAIDLALEIKSTEITILGAIGTRLDHTMANIHILKQALDKNIKAKIVNEKNEIELINKEIIIKKDDNYKYVSIIPLTTNVTGITIEGMKYIINDYTLSIGDSLGVSNEQIDKEAKISIKTGILVVIKSKD
mgnify:FL=1